MDFYALSDPAIEEELGQRVRALRLRRNVTQETLAERTTLAVNTIKSLEKGRGKLATLIAVLRELGALEQLDLFLPEPGPSPLQLAKMQGKVRERASGDRGAASDPQPNEDDREW